MTFCIDHVGKQRLWALPMIGILLIAAGCGKPDPANRPRMPDQEFKFSVLYKLHCAGCHGPNGSLGVAPPLNDNLFRTIIPLEELETVIAKGRPGTLMPAFGKSNGGPLTPEQVLVMVFEISGRAYRVVDKADGSGKAVEFVPGRPDDIQLEWGYPPDPRLPPPPYFPPTDMKPGSWQAGEKVFQKACAGCHGANGRIDAMFGSVNEPAMLTLLSPQVLRRLIITGLPGMPDYSEGQRRLLFEPLTSQQIADLEALLLHWRQGTSTRAK